MFGSSLSEAGHLIIQAAPYRIRRALRAVDGIGWDPIAPANRQGFIVLGHHRYPLVIPRGVIHVHDWRVRIVFVSTENDSTALRDHVVFLWTVGGHTYMFGFHDLQGFAVTVRLDRVVMSGIRLVPPGSGRRPAEPGPPARPCCSNKKFRS